MGDLSEHFSRSEFKCRCKKYCKGTHDFVDAELIKVLEDLRHHFARPVTINSGTRCSAHNKEEGGSEASQHIHGRAADVVVDGVPADLVANYLEALYPYKYGIGRYKGRTHIDVRKTKARWRIK